MQHVTGKESFRYFLRHIVPQIVFVVLLHKCISEVFGNMQLCDVFEPGNRFLVGNHFTTPPPHKQKRMQSFLRH